jgi:lactate permease
MNARILPITSVIVPFWLVRTMVGWAETFEVLPAILVCGVSFATTQFLWGNYVDPYLVDIVGGVVSLVVTAVFMKFWKPKKVFTFEEDRGSAAEGGVRYTTGQIVHGWMPFLILGFFVLLWGWPSVKTYMNTSFAISTGCPPLVPV